MSTIVEALETAVRLAVHAAGGVDAAAEAIGVSRATVSNWQNGNCPHQISLSNAVKLDRFNAENGGRMYLLEWHQKYAATGPSVAALFRDGDPVTAASTLAKGVGEVHGAMADALKDGKITVAEAQRIRENALDALHAAESMVATINNFIAEMAKLKAVEAAE